MAVRVIPNGHRNVLPEKDLKRWVAFPGAELQPENQMSIWYEIGVAGRRAGIGADDVAAAFFRPASVEGRPGKVAQRVRAVKRGAVTISFRMLCRLPSTVKLFAAG